jgi:hypothetical protein
MLITLANTTVLPWEYLLTRGIAAKGYRAACGAFYIPLAALPYRAALNAIQRPVAAL